MDYVLGERLRLRRDKLKMSVTDLAMLMETSRSLINDYEKNKVLPSVKALLRLSEILLTTPHYLLGLTDNPEDVDLPANLSEIERDIMRHVHAKPPEMQSKILDIIKVL